ncbi:hypothetical protein IWW34DRAFT_886729 [Fusarium oxysporum f. sp. albedinis]|nr:hypothetical protein IWW34DRAFT_886729 [Fusarium oxysporum f. sp. albedinis]
MTGGSSGIGLSVATHLVKHGAKVMIADLSSPKEPIPGCSFHQTDVTSWASLLSLFDETMKTLGGIDIVCANAGIMEGDQPFEDRVDVRGIPVEPKHLSVHVNLIGAMNTVKLAIHFFKKTKTQGSIVITGSLASMATSYNPTCSYAASKHGVIGLMRGLRDYLPKFDITINAVAPGFTDTRIFPVSNAMETLKNAHVKIQHPDAVALAILALAQERDWNGKSIGIVDGKYWELEESVAKGLHDAMEGGQNNAERRKVGGQVLAATEKVMYTVI